MLADDHQSIKEFVEYCRNHHKTKYTTLSSYLSVFENLVTVIRSEKRNLKLSDNVYNDLLDIPNSIVLLKSGISSERGKEERQLLRDKAKKNLMVIGFTDM